MSRFLNSLLLSSLFATILLSGTTQARELRNKRVLARIEADDDAEVAVVRQVYPTPYTAAGYRPGRAFNLPTEDESFADGEGSGLGTTTTEYPTTTTEAIVEETTTPYNWAPAELASDDAAKQGRAAKAPYPPSGWRPNRAFLLPNEVPDEQGEELDTAAQTDNDRDFVDASSTPTPLAPFTTRQPLSEEVTELSTTDATAVTTAPQPARTSGRKAPYPPSGWRPSRAFLLPTEVEAANQESGISVNEPEAPVSAADKAGHPACGVSDNPMSPKPAEDAKENPDAERVYVTANLGPAVVGAPLTVPVFSRSQRLITPPIYVPAGRPFAYSATVQSWR